MCLALDGTVASCCTEGAFKYDGVCTILSCLDGLSIRDGCSCYDIETACELLAGLATDIVAEYATDIAYETAKDISDMCDMVGECCADDGTATTNIEWDSCMAETAEEAENFVPDIVELLLGSIPGIPGGLPDLVPTGSIASLTCLALNGTVASCCTEDDVPNDGVCSILSCLDGLSIRDGCSCYDIEAGCDLLAAYVADIANARNITDITDISDMCDMVGECCADDGTTITNIDWDFCMAEAAEEANFEMPDIVEILLGSIPGLLDLIPTGSTPETGGTPATISAPTATAVVNVAAPTTTPTETPTVAAMTPAPTPAPLDTGTVTGVDNTCIICPDGTDVDNFAPYADTGDFRTCANLINEAKLYETGSDDCGLFEFEELNCCYKKPDNPCNICPDGATAGDEYVPEYADNSVTRATCKDLIDWAKQFETGSDACGRYDIDVAYCCPSPASVDDSAVAPTTTASTLGAGTGADNLCIICLDGTAADDFAPHAEDGDSRTCADFIDEAKLYEPGSDDCGWFEFQELYCCYTIPVNPCIICPDGATAGDDYVPEYEGNTATCSGLIGGVKQFESGSDACGRYDIDVSHCCPPGETPPPTPMPVDDTTVATTTTSSTLAPEVDTPCIICPNGATADYDNFQPFAGAGEMKTCKELLDGMSNVAVEGGLELCESMREIEAFCCGDVDSAPSPVEPLPTSPALGGGASVSGLVGFTFISIASTLCVIACMEVYDISNCLLHKYLLLFII